MLTQTQEEQPKVFDPEETRQEQAQRLIQEATEKYDDRARRLRDRLRLHCRALSQRDQRRLVAHLRRDCDKTVGIIEDLAGELPGFTFLPDPSEEAW